MKSRDTSSAAAAIALELNRAAGPAERFRQALELSDTLYEMARAGIRARHPEYSEAEVGRALIVQLHGEIARR
jgi:Rv0078B-related antitoxin